MLIMKAITRSSKEKLFEFSFSDTILELLTLHQLSMEEFLSQAKLADRSRVQRSLYYLKRKQFLAFPAKSPKGHIVLTKLGLRRLNKRKFEKLNIEETAWDGRWRLLTFDIPEKQAGARHVLQRKLKQLGFYHFQRSVFMLPYECKKEILMIASYLKIAPCVHLLLADRFQGDEQLIKKFSLHLP